MKIFNIIAAAAIAATMASCAVKTTPEAEGTNAVDPKEQANSIEAVDTAKGIVDLADDSALRPGMTVDQLTFIDFNATWCGPCKKFAPTFEEIAGEYAGKALFYSVDVDVHPELAAEYGVQGIPHIQFINPADPAANTSLVGLQTKEDFTAALNAFLK